MSEGTMTERGWVQEVRLGDLRFCYRSGRDSPRATPVFDMSVGEVTVENLGERAVNLKYSIPEVFFGGHVFEFGANQERRFSHPHVHWPGPEDEMSYDCGPGRKGLLSRQDYMSLFHKLGRPHFVDGFMRTHYAAALLVDDAPLTLEFGPHLFEVDLDRDWDEEQARYLDFFAARDRGEIPL